MEQEMESDFKINGTIILTSDATNIIMNEMANYYRNKKFVITDVKYLDKTMKISGPKTLFVDEFETDFVKMEIKGGIYHKNTIDIKVKKWNKYISTILGLSTFPLKRPPLNRIKSRVVGGTFTPLELASIYNFPISDGTGQSVGIIQLAGGYKQSDLVAYLNYLGINTTPNVVAISVDGGRNNTSDVASSEEVTMDIEIVLAIVPKARINVYFAPNTNQGFYDAFNRAIQDNNSVITTSWGESELVWTSSAMLIFNNLFQNASNRGITILAASGDQGSTDGQSVNSVDFPASSPYVTGCGGTTLSTDNTNTTITSEVVWNTDPTTSATGGGFSKIFPRPSYQNGINLTGVTFGNRGVPDVAGNADPNTGYKIMLNGSINVFGGTSAVAPLWAGMMTRINQSSRKRMGFVNPILYANLSNNSTTNAFRDIVQGNNGSYSATTGWDPCTGLGTPNGINIQSVLNGGSGGGTGIIVNFSANRTTGTIPLSVTFTNTSSNLPTTFTSLWDFGDGTTSSLLNPTHTYTVIGTYTVKLTITVDSTSYSAIKNNYIVASKTVPNPPPTNISLADFSGTPVSGPAPLTVNFTDLSTDTPTRFSWSFGDGGSSTVENPTHTYTRKGRYTVVLYAINRYGYTSKTKRAYITVL